MKRQMKSSKLVQKYGLREKVEREYFHLCSKKYGDDFDPLDVELEFEAKRHVLYETLAFKKQKLSELMKKKSTQICDAYQGISIKDLTFPLIEEICQDCVHYEEHLERLSKEIIELEKYAEIIKHDYEILVFNSGLH